MTDIPQLGPEVYVDDEDEVARKQAATSTTEPFLFPMDNPQSPFLSHGLDGARRQRDGEVSPGVSPRLSPHRPTNAAFSFDAADLNDPSGSANSSRRGSAVSAENVLDVLDNSAWGDSIRRSFTTRRPNDGSSS